MPKILVFAGSARRDSVNKKLARAAASAVDGAGGQSTLLDLADFELPLYDGDVEAASGLPEAARRLQQAFRDHDGFCLACPEYNGSITPLLKNVIDWVSRPDGGEKGPSPYRGKTVLLVAASPGGLGGLRGLVHVRAILGNLGCLVLPDQRAFGHSLFPSPGPCRGRHRTQERGQIQSRLSAWGGHAPMIA